MDWILEQALKYHVSVFMPKSCYIPEDVDGEDRRLQQPHGLPLRAAPGAAAAGGQARPADEGPGLARQHGRRAHLPTRTGSPTASARTARRRSCPPSRTCATWQPGQVWFEDDASPLPAPGCGAARRRWMWGWSIPETKQAKVKFAIEEVRQDGWHPMTMIECVRGARPVGMTLLMPIETIEDWEQRLARQDAFWAGEIIDRPVGEHAPVEGRSRRYPWPEKQLRHAARALAGHGVRGRTAPSPRPMNTEYLGDALPHAWPNLGPEVFSAFFGCEIEFGEDTSWSLPCLHDWSEVEQAPLRRGQLLLAEAAGDDGGAAGGGQGQVLHRD